MRLVSARALLARAVFVLVVLVVAHPREARAQDASPAVDVLRSSPSVRARLRAAGAIGRTRPRGGLEALESALTDPDARVRSAVVGALSAFGDASAVPPLLALGNDHDRRVRDAVTRAVTELNAHAPGTMPPANGVSVPMDSLDVHRPATAVDWRRVHYVVGVGTIVNQARGASGFVGVVRTAIEQELRGRNGLAARTPSMPSSVAARIRSGAVRTFSLEGGVSSLRPVDVASAAAVRAEISLLLISEPSHAIVGTITGAATAEQSVSAGATPRVDDDLTIHAIQAAVRSALSHVEDNLQGARAR